VHSPFPREMTITWNVTRLAISSEGLETPRCGDCQATLNVHQPDENRPDHLLGTCDACGRWFLIEIGTKREAFLFDLPNVTLIREAVAAGKPKPRPRSGQAAKGEPKPDPGRRSGNHRT
jgi:hypothetical protein